MHQNNRFSIFPYHILPTNLSLTSFFFRNGKNRHSQRVGAAKAKVKFTERAGAKIARGDDTRGPHKMSISTR